MLSMLPIIRLDQEEDNPPDDQDSNRQAARTVCQTLKKCVSSSFVTAEVITAYCRKKPSGSVVIFMDTRISSRQLRSSRLPVIVHDC